MLTCKGLDRVSLLMQLTIHLASYEEDLKLDNEEIVSFYP